MLCDHCIFVPELFLPSFPCSLWGLPYHFILLPAAGRPTGFSDAPAGYTPAPAGFSDGPPGGAPYQAPAVQSGGFGESTRKVQIPNAKVRCKCQFQSWSEGCEW